eukprot:15447303-Alexandrium_andersonii.AAC.1
MQSPRPDDGHGDHRNDPSENDGEACRGPRGHCRDRGSACAASAWRTCGRAKLYVPTAPLHA